VPATVQHVHDPGASPDVRRAAAPYGLSAAMPTCARALAMLTAVTVAAAMLTGCGAEQHGADKAGGSQHAVVLRLAASYDFQLADGPLATFFATQVERLSRGRLRVQVVFNAAGGDNPFAELRIAQLVRSGRFDLGWIGARAWNELGVNSLQALEAPFLITSYPLLERVVKSPLADKMLAGLAGAHVRGLALIPGLLHHPASLKRPLVSLRDFAGARMRAQPSHVADALFRALGAVPVHVEGEGIGASLAFQALDGFETSLANPPVSSIITANVTFFPKVVTLFANEAAFARLTAGQRRVVDRAARRTAAHVVDFSLHHELGYEGVLARWYCAHTPGRIALADPQELQAFVRAARPVYAELARDPETKYLIAAIRRTKASLPAPPPIAVPAGCLRPRQPPLAGPVRPPSLLDGTYHWRLTKAAALAFGPPASDNPDHSPYPIIFGVVLHDGRAITIDGNPAMIGTYTITGNHVTFLWRDFGYPLTFRFRRDPSGTLFLSAVHPMDRGDEFVWSGAPWRRVGAPVLTP
jgi:C4-dicarboxylate-binding protein DctP